MKTLLVVITATAFLMLGACASREATEVSPESTNYLMHYEDGIITGIKPVIIKDNGTGSFLGAITGAVLGSVMGRGRGNALTTLAGGLLGTYAGNEAGKANAQELMVDLNNGETAVVISKGQKFSVGQHIRIVLENGNVVSVEHD